MLAALACNRLKDGEYNLTLLTTNDVHGRFFDSTYVDANLRKSLIGVSRVVDSVRVADGAENVVLVDAGDCLQGDNAAYYFNYVDTLGPHLYSRMVDYLHYDALAWGNHDVETGHPVYDRVFSEMKAFKVPLLAGNAIRNDNGKTYFPLYTMVRRAGLKIAILGYTNANIKAWLNEEIWSGMHFDRIMDHVQEDVDRVRAAEKPDVVIAAMHSATGKGDGSVAEAEALDVFRSVRGVDFVVCAHDHRPYTEQNDTMALVNSGSHCRYVGIGKLSLRVEGGKVTEKHISGGLIPVFAEKADIWPELNLCAVELGADSLIFQDAQECFIDPADQAWFEEKGIIRKYQVSWHSADDQEAIQILKSILETCGGRISIISQTVSTYSSMERSGKGVAWYCRPISVSSMM